MATAKTKSNDIPISDRQTPNNTTVVNNDSQKTDDHDINMNTSLSNDSEDTDNTEEEEEEEENINNTPGLPLEQRIIRKVHIEGNKHVTTPAVLAATMYTEGERFNPLRSNHVIRNLYETISRFQNITIEAALIGTDEIDLYIIVEEKPILDTVLFKGNKHLSEKEINKKINFQEVFAIDEAQAKKFAQIIQRMYVDKGYFLTTVEPHLVVNDQDYAELTFIVHEGEKSFIKKIDFIGNDNIQSRTLRTAIFSKEDWLFGFLSSSGSYHPERLDADKHFLEQLYQNYGYLHAKVTDIKVWIDPETSTVSLTFEIEEGSQYKIKEVNISGNGVVKDEFLLEKIPIKPGDIYSREKIVETIKNLEYFWSNMGYMYNHIEPSMQPDPDTHTISITFNTTLGEPVEINRINIIGNKKTQDKIIRRQITLEEGGLVTQKGLDDAKNSVLSLGYFDQKEGVNWKVTRLSKGLADLDLILKEAKTGEANAKLEFGGINDIRSAMAGTTLELKFADRNFLGKGINASLTGKLSQVEQDIIFNFTQPWLFDKPIYGSADIVHRRIGYDQLHFTNVINEHRTNGAGTIGGNTMWPKYPFFNNTYIRFTSGVDRVRYENPPVALASLTPDVRAEYQGLLNNLFTPGTFVWFSVQAGQDTKNHPLHPSRGYSWLARTQVAIPTPGYNIGFYKLDLDINWYTPLIGDYDLVFRLRAFIGLASNIRNFIIPYRDLFHIGGFESVRGFLYGQLGPQFTIKDGSNLDGLQDSIGGKKALFFKAELTFPIFSDLTLKGLFFYDGGNGWDTPYQSTISAQYLENNHFNYRHSVGFGIRALQPMPLRIDLGYKIDARKGESPYEFHFSMSYDW